MAVYGYIRVSTDEQGDGTSPEDQEKKIRGLAMMTGLDVDAVYYDRGVSGSVKLAERPQGGKLLETLKNGDTVIVSKLDRMFRSANDALATAEWMKERGVNLVLIDMGTEPVTANGASKMFFGMLALVAEFERERIRERLSEGRSGKKAKGGHIGGSAPFGYRVVGEGKEAVLEPVPEQQAAIERAKEMRAAGASYRKIEAALQDDGHSVSREALRRILSETAEA